MDFSQYTRDELDRLHELAYHRAIAYFERAEMLVRHQDQGFRVALSAGIEQQELARRIRDEWETGTEVPGE